MKNMKDLQGLYIALQYVNIYRKTNSLTFSTYTGTHIYTLLLYQDRLCFVCCLYLTNVKTTEPNEPKIFEATHFCTWS